MPIHWEPALVEAAVLAAAADAPPFHEAREPLYAIADAEAREAAFLALHAAWFQRLNLDRPLRRALAERPALAAACGRCVVTRARAAAAEAADLLVAPPAAPTLLVRLTPERLAAGERLLAFLRRELLHVADMVDPRFGYEPRLPAGGGPEGRCTTRYRVLWDASVDGRLTAEGRAPAGARPERLQEFRRAFPGLGGAAEAAFRRFFDGPRPTHAEMVAFASSGGVREGRDRVTAAR
jgi:hypothetical protein